jgi:hypothetical protein
MMKTMDHTVAVGTAATWKDFTKHGLHLCMTGKDRMANLRRKVV